MAKQQVENLTAADIMQRDIVVVRTSDTLRDALSLMTENHVTGLPVMDRHSKCVGLISVTDILNYEQEHAEDAPDETTQYFNPDTQQWESVRTSSFALERFGDVRVEEMMAYELVSVARDTPVADVAQKMIDDDVHRVLVLSNDSRLLGIVSAIDFVRMFTGQE